MGIVRGVMVIVKGGGIDIMVAMMAMNIGVVIIARKGDMAVENGGGVVIIGEIES